MKILMTNNTLRHLAGTETYTYALAVQLTKMGHAVSCYSPDLGQVAARLTQQGISVFSDFREAPGSIRPQVRGRLGGSPRPAAFSPTGGCSCQGHTP
jgi:hypothetical protein